MDIRKTALIGIFCGAWSVAALAGVEEKMTSADEETSPAAASKTYIESGPFGFIKIEIPTPGKVLGKQESGKGKEGSEDEQVDVCLLPLVELSGTRKGPGFLFHVAFLKIPFFKVQALTSKGKLFVPDDDWNPFWPAAPKNHPNTALLDQPLFCFYDTVKLYEDIVVKGKAHFDSDTSWFAARSRWLDTPLVSLWEMERWGKGQYYRWKFLDTCFATTLGYEKSRTQFAFRILDTPIASTISGFRYSRDEKERDTRFFSVIVVSVWESREKEGKKEQSFLVSPMFGGGVWESKQEEGKRKRSFLTAPLDVASVWESEQKKEAKKWTFLAVPLCGAVTRSAEGEKKRLTILGTENMNPPSGQGRGGAPTIALWHQNREDKETSSRQFLRLPLIGPVWAAWEDKEEARWGIFPRLFFWKKFRY